MSLSFQTVDQVSVSGSVGGPWTVTFGGTQAGTNVSRMDGDVSEATAGTLQRTLSFSYDAAGQLTGASDPDSSYAVSYDNLGRVLSVDNNGTAGVPRVILSSQYDAAGNRTGLFGNDRRHGRFYEHVLVRCAESFDARRSDAPGERQQRGGEAR